MRKNLADIQAAMRDRLTEERDQRVARSRRRATAKARKSRTQQLDEAKTRKKRYYKKRTVSNVLRKFAEAEHQRKERESELERLDRIVKSWALL